MLILVDRKLGILVQKITDTKGNLIRYQTVPEEKKGFSGVRIFSTLQEARESLNERAAEYAAQKAAT